jgi:hypothetical protein
MSWKRRNGKYYYYHSERRGQKVVSRYVGRGAPGQIAADLVLERKQAREAFEAVLNNHRQLLPGIVAADRWADLLVASELVLAGCYRHARAAWRIHHGRFSAIVANADAGRVSVAGKAS